MSGLIEWFKEAKLWQKIAAGVGAFFVVAVILSPFTGGDDDDELVAEDAVEETTTTAGPATTEAPAVTEAPTTEAPATTAAPTTTAAAVLEAESCDGGGALFDTVPGATCQEVFDAADVVLVQHGFEAGSVGAQIQVGSICSAMAGDNPVTYLPESPYIPELADALANVYCPGDRSLIVPA